MASKTVLVVLILYISSCVSSLDDYPRDDVVESWDWSKTWNKDETTEEEIEGENEGTSFFGVKDTVDPCEEDPCLDGQKCKVNGQSYECLEHRCKLVRKRIATGSVEAVCACEEGFQVNSEFVCLDIDECRENNPCNSNSVCSNSRGSYNCTCKPGFERLDKNNCVDIDECTSGLHNCTGSFVCINTPGYFRCACSRGFNLLENGTCQDIDECQNLTIVAGCDGLHCINVPGSFHCGCHKGYKETRNTVFDSPRWGLDDYEFEEIGKPTKQCDDINECNPRTECLDPGMTCKNTDGGFICGCLDGWHMTNGTCARKECRGIRMRDGSCSCPAGFTRKKFPTFEKCVDIDECATSIIDRPCGLDDFCINTFGSHHCISASCPTGYSSNGRDKYWCYNDNLMQGWCYYRPSDCIKRFPGALTILHSFVSINPNVQIEEPLFTIESLVNTTSFQFTIRDSPTKKWFTMDGASLKLVTPLSGPQEVTVVIDVMNQVPYVGVVHTSYVHIYVHGPNFGSMPSITTLMYPTIFKAPAFKHFDG